MFPLHTLYSLSVKEGISNGWDAQFVKFLYDFQQPSVSWFLYHWILTSSFKFRGNVIRWHMFHLHWGEWRMYCALEFKVSGVDCAPCLPNSHFLFFVIIFILFNERDRNNNNFIIVFIILIILIVFIIAILSILLACILYFLYIFLSYR